jgi:chloramphenicol-sensitive protein RarD
MADSPAPQAPAPSTGPVSTAYVGDSSAGFAYGIAAYGLWGVIPLYFKLLTHVAPTEVLAHRAVWSFTVLLAAVLALGLVGDVRRVLADRRTLFTLMASAALIAVNWFAYIYAVTTQQVVQAGLGYFITPLANVLLGVTLLRERMRGFQVVALLFAAVGVGILTVRTGQVPWISLSLATSFSLYGFVRKVAKAEAMIGLFVETALMLPLALTYLGYLYQRGTVAFTPDDPRTICYLMVGGIVTTIPLVCFAAAVRRLRMTTLGFLQFLSPSLQVAVAVFLFDEPFTRAYREAFPLVLIAVALYLADAVLARRRAV